MEGESDRITPIEDEAKKEGHFGNNRRASWGLTTYDGPGMILQAINIQRGGQRIFPPQVEPWDTRHTFQLAP